MTNKKSRKLNLIIVLVFVLITGISLNVLAEDPAASPEVKPLMTIINETVAQWYYILRYFSIAAMLCILIYLGIRVAISSIAEDKAKYKRLLVDWVAGFIIIFTIHYFMILILKINDICVETIKNVTASVADNVLTEDEKALGMMPSTQGLYETVRTRAYELRFSIGTSGMIMYMVLVYYTIRFLIIYFKRFLTVMILTILAPLMGLFYAFNKISSGKSPLLRKWAEEYAFNVLLQTIHALIYGVFVQLSLLLAADSVAGFVISLIMLNFMMKAEKIFRKIFKFSANIADDNADKGIKENMAALTAMKASAAGLFGGEMAKDLGQAVKRGAGTIVNAGFTADLRNRQKEMQDKNKELFNKKQQREHLNKELAEEKDEEKRKELKEKKAKLDKQIKQMEEERKDLDKYLEKAGEYNGDSQTKKLMEDKKQKERNKAIEEEYQRRLQYHKDLYGEEYTEEEKKKVKQEVENEINQQVIERRFKENERTGKKELEQSVANVFMKDINAKFWGSNAVKSATKDAVMTTFTGVKGLGEMFVGIPLVVTEPAAGFALLSKGIKDSNKLFGNNEYKKVTTLSERNSIKKVQKRNKKVYRKQRKEERKNRKYTFNRFNPHSLETIKSEMLMDRKANSIKKLNLNTMGNVVLTAPLRLTGIWGAARTIQSKAYKIEEAKKNYNLRVETYMTIEKKNSMNKDFNSYYNARVDNFRATIEAKGPQEIIARYKKDAGKIFTVGEKTFQFNRDKISFGTDIKTTPTGIGEKTETTTKKENLSQTDILDNILLNVAVNNRVFDLQDLNLRNEKVQTELIENLQQLGMVETEATNEELTAQIEEFQERIREISKNNPSAVEEKLAENTIIDYMSRNNIEDEKELQKAEHREKIKTEIITILETEEKKIEDAEKQRKEALVFDEEFEKVKYFHEGGDEAAVFEERFKVYEKKQKREKRENFLEELISSLETVEPTKEIISTEELAIITESKEMKMEIDRQVNIEKVQKIDNELIGLEQLIEGINQRRMYNAFENPNRDYEQEEKQEEEDSVLIDEYIRNNISTQNDVLVENLLAMLEQDKIGIELKFKPSGYERKRLSQMDTERMNSTYRKKIYNRKEI